MSAVFSWALFFLWGYVWLVSYPAAAFRILNTQTGQPNGTYFKPYDRGFVGVYGESSNYRRERVNEGAFETSEQDLFYEGVSPRQACPNMVGPFSDGNYYCSAREFGFCDRRSGTCFCNTGYQGIDCSECQDSYFKIGAHCYPKKLCPNDCSGAGTCNYNNGTCTCLPHRTGTTCETMLCSIHSPLCVTCTLAECLQCSGGYYLSGDSSVCRSCYDFDPRCAGCIKETGCTVCADSTLTSVRRSGYRGSDPALPEEEDRREFSITLPFGTKSPESFAAAESYFVVASLGETPLKNQSLTCSQGLNNDESWSCSRYSESNVVCGHFGVFTLLYPNYAVLESDKRIRMTVQRSGGGYGNVTINYYIKHYTTNDSDVVATAAYTTAQQLVFEHGTVQRSFLISILDDTIVEENEVFQVVLETPEGGGAVGAQFRANVTIIDDDALLTSPSLTNLIQNTSSSTAGDPFSITVQAILGNGNHQLLGGDKFYAALENDLSSWVAPLGISGLNQRQSRRKRCLVTDLGNGQHTITTSVNEQGAYQLRVWYAFPHTIRGEYFYDAYFENIAVERLDHAVNFTWGTGRLIPRGTDYISVRWSGALMTESAGNYSFLVHADDHARLWVDSQLLLDHFHERAVNTEPSRMIWLPANTLIELVLEYREVTGDAFAVLKWKPPQSSHFDVIPSDSLYSLFEVDRSPSIVTISSAATAAQTTECHGDGLYSATAGHSSSFVVCPRDSFGNLRDDDDFVRLKTEYFSSTLSLIDDLGFQGVGSEFIMPQLTYDLQSHCFLGVYTAERSGTYQLNVTFRQYPDDPPAHVAGSPFEVFVSPDKAFGPYSLVWGLPDPLTMEAGQCHNFTVITRDRSKNFLQMGGDNIQVYSYRVDYFNETLGPRYSATGIQGTSYPTMLPTTSISSNVFLADKVSDAPQAVSVVRYGVVSDLGNGNYSVRICPVIAGLHEVHVLLKGKGVSNQNFRILDRQHSVTEGLGRGTFMGQHIDSSPFSLSVHETKASTITSTVEGTGLATAVVGVPAYFKITVRDPFDNVLRTSVHKPNVSLSLDRSPSAAVTIWDYKNGSYLLGYTATKSGMNLVSVFVNGYQIQGSPFAVPIADGKTNESFSYAFGNGLFVGTTGKASYFQLFSFDLSGNRKSGFADVYTFSVTGANTLSGLMLPCSSPGTPFHAVCNENDTLGGSYWASFVPTITGANSISVYLVHDSAISEVSNSPFSMTTLPSQPKAELTDISGALYDVTAGITAQVFMQLRDYFGNKLVNGGYSFEIGVLGVGAQWGTVLPFDSSQGLPDAYNYKGFHFGYPDYYGSVTDNGDGSYSSAFTVPKSGLYVLRIALAELGLNATYFNDTSFGQLFDNSFASQNFVQSLQGRADNYGSSISWTGDIGGCAVHDGSRNGCSYYGMYRTRNEPVVNVSSSLGIDTYLNGSSNASVLFNFREHFWSARWTGMITPIYPEIYKFTFDIDDDSAVNLWLGGIGVETNGSYKGEHVLNVSMNSRKKFAFYNFSDVRYREFLLEFVHYSGDAQLRIYWESLSTPFQLIPASAFSHWRNASHYNLTVHPNSLCSHCSTAFGSSLTSAQVAVEQSFTVYARDQYGNLLQRGGDEVTMFAVGVDGIAFRGTVVDYWNSTYLIKYVPAVSGRFRLFVTVGCCVPNFAVGQSVILDSVKHLLVQGEPFILDIAPSRLSAPNSPATGQGIVGGVVGLPLSFSIAFRDLHDNPTAVIDPTRVAVEVEFLSALNGDTVIPDSLAIAVSPNAATVNYTFVKNGLFYLAVKLNSRESPNTRSLDIVGSPFALVFDPESPAPNKAICRGIGMRQALVDAVDEAQFEIQLYDRFGNKLDEGGDKFFIRVVGDANYSSPSMPVVPFCYDTQGGRYLCLYRPTYSGKHQLHVMLLHREFRATGGSGLTGQYFTSRDGALLDLQNPPMLSRVDSQVLFNWDEGVGVQYSSYGSKVSLPGSLSDHRLLDSELSIRWTGYLVAPTSDIYSISALSAGIHVMVFLDQELVFDNSVVSIFDGDAAVSRRVTLQGNSSYAIRIVAQFDRGNAAKTPAFINLGWKTATVSFNTISRSYLYPFATEIPLSPFPVKVH